MLSLYIPLLTVRRANVISHYSWRCLCVNSCPVCVSALRHPYMRYEISIYETHVPLPLEVLPWQKIHGKKSYIMSLLSRGSIHQGHEGFSGQSRGKQCSFMRLSALLTTQTIPVIEWNSTTIDNALVQGDNMYLNVFNNDLIFPRKGFLSLNNLPTVVKVVCCRQILRLFVSTGL